MYLINGANGTGLVDENPKVTLVLIELGGVNSPKGTWEINKFKEEFEEFDPSLH
jgi:hypothetical protein